MALFSGFAPVLEVVAFDDKGQGDTQNTSVASRWAVYREVEETRSETGKLGADKLGADKSSQAPLSLASVVESLVDARSDLAVIIDIATVLADQQHLGVSHVPQSVVAEVQGHNLLGMSLKRRQLMGIASRLRAGAAILRDKYCSEQDIFASDVEELGRRWPIREFKGTGTSHADDCVLVTVRFQVEDGWTWLDSDSLGKHTFVIARNQNDGSGCACAVFQDRLLSGWREIDAQLLLLRSERAWKLIRAALEEEAVATDAVDATALLQTDVQRAVLALSRVSSSSSLPASICREGRMMYLEKFCRTDLCRNLFRRRAMVALRTASEWCLIPNLVRRTTPTRHSSFMEQLCKWLSFSAMWYEVVESLGEGDPRRQSILEYIGALASSSDCVPAHVRIGSTCVSIDESYSMKTPGATVGRLQLKELLVDQEVGLPDVGEFSWGGNKCK
jgi:hypothetical protein